MNKGLSEGERKLNIKIMDRVYEGMKSGKNANELLNTFSTADKSRIVKFLELANKIPTSPLSTGFAPAGQQ